MQETKRTLFIEKLKLKEQAFNEKGPLDKFCTQHAYGFGKTATASAGTPNSDIPKSPFSSLFAPNTSRRNSESCNTFASNGNSPGGKVNSNKPLFSSPFPIAPVKSQNYKSKGIQKGTFATYLNPHKEITPKDFEIVTTLGFDQKLECLEVFFLLIFVCHVIE